MDAPARECALDRPCDGADLSDSTEGRGSDRSEMRSGIGAAAVSAGGALGDSLLARARLSGGFGAGATRLRYAKRLQPTAMITKPSGRHSCDLLLRVGSGVEGGVIVLTASRGSAAGSVEAKIAGAGASSDAVSLTVDAG